MTGYCSGCGELVEEVVCVEEIPDFCCGRPACQRHEYLGSPCCGEEVIPIEEMEESGIVQAKDTPAPERFRL